MENKTFIYTLCDPNTNEIRYIGKTNNLDYRLRKHINESKNKRTHKERWVDSLIIKGLLPIIEILDIVDEIEWCFYETYWISQFKTWGFNLTNGTSGGEGSDGFKGKNHSNETKEKCRIAGTKSSIKFLGEKNGRSKLTDKQVEEIKEKVLLGINRQEIATEYNINKKYMNMDRYSNFIKENKDIVEFPIKKYISLIRNIINNKIEEGENKFEFNFLGIGNLTLPIRFYLIIKYMIFNIFFIIYIYFILL